MTPKIDYTLLGEATLLYEKLGYEYVEAPWVVGQGIIRETLPAQFPYYRLAQQQMTTADSRCSCRSDNLESIGGLVGSAEQSLLSMKNLSDGVKYMAITPCFRIEDETNLLTRQMFMKIELYMRGPDADMKILLNDAIEVMTSLKEIVHVSLDRTETNEGVDLAIGGIEVGSYGIRETSRCGRWAYGTGLALPRFTVAQAIASVI